MNNSRFTNQAALAALGLFAAGGIAFAATVANPTNSPATPATPAVTTNSPAVRLQAEAPLPAATNTVTTNATSRTATTNAPARAATTNAAVRAATNAPAIVVKKIDDADIQTIINRNIFNPNRTPGGPQNPFGTNRVEQFAYTGFISYGGNAFALFDGIPSATYRTSVTNAQGTIAGYKVVEVKANAVTLEVGGALFELPSDKKLSRTNGGAWVMATRLPTDFQSSLAALAGLSTSELTNVLTRALSTRANRGTTGNNGTRGTRGGNGNTTGGGRGGGRGGGGGGGGGGFDTGIPGGYLANGEMTLNLFGNPTSTPAGRSASGTAEMEAALKRLNDRRTLETQ